MFRSHGSNLSFPSEFGLLHRFHEMCTLGDCLFVASPSRVDFCDLEYVWVNPSHLDCHGWHGFNRIYKKPHVWLTIFDATMLFASQVDGFCGEALSLLGLARDFSWGLSCPFHCPGSIIPPFVLDLFLDLSVGLDLACSLPGLPSSISSSRPLSHLPLLQRWILEAGSRSPPHYCYPILGRCPWSSLSAWFVHFQFCDLHHQGFLRHPELEEVINLLAEEGPPELPDCPKTLAENKLFYVSGDPAARARLAFRLGFSVHWYQHSFWVRDSQLWFLCVSWRSPEVSLQGAQAGSPRERYFSYLLDWVKFLENVEEINRILSPVRRELYKSGQTHNQHASTLKL